ncbi:stretch-activated Ca2+-permeable channel component-domain-containing protein [Lineolata rhizophorae]|uniref:Stretch-activated Ca2+-permeable channel component-domain-containing protein n=1 Tax=Lineolata rhizophorae TaxID=578093 RepID=A0A6A6PFD6_9PEZI|nr:stretch-activated Ca2+-permeable channel component-domain-containing protein [Lineolata rhizophorae]
MQLPRLTPLQSRFAASLAATLLLAVIYFTLVSPPSFAYAAEVSIRQGNDGVGEGELGELSRKRGGVIDGTEDHNHVWIGQEQGTEEQDEDYLVEGVLMGRQEDDSDDSDDDGDDGPAPDPFGLNNNVPDKKNLLPGGIEYYVVLADTVSGELAPEDSGRRFPPPTQNDDDDEDSSSKLELRKRQTSDDIRTLYVSVNTCLQPQRNGSSTDSDDSSTTPPQLTLWISTSTTNRNPGPDSLDSATAYPLVEGFAGLAINVSTSDDTFMSVSAPDLSSDGGFSGGWNFEIGASIDSPYHGANSTTSLLRLLDTDNGGALLMTTDGAAADGLVDLTSMNDDPPYSLVAFNANGTGATSMAGLRSSYCGLRNMAMADSGANIDVAANLTMRGVEEKDGRPRQQFFLQGLNATSGYYAFLMLGGNGDDAPGGDGASVGGGGMVWKAMNFTTKTDNNCRIIFDLPFCTDVAYAVPTNPDRVSDLPDLMNIYDSFASDAFANFSRSVDQIACNTTMSAQYSLASSCQNCTDAYKAWLCAVSIPRCLDFTRAADPDSGSGDINPQPDSAGSADQDPIFNLSPRHLAAQGLDVVERNLGQPFVNGSEAPSATVSETDPRVAERGRQAALGARNARLNERVRPGPYRELLPCEDLCFALVQACPASLGFRCASRGGRGPGGNLLAWDYGVRNGREGVEGGGDGADVGRCKPMGRSLYNAAAAGRPPAWGVMMVGFVVVAVMLA